MYDSLMGKTRLLLTMICYICYKMPFNAGLIVFYYYTMIDEIQVKLDFEAFDFTRYSGFIWHYTFLQSIWFCPGTAVFSDFLQVHVHFQLGLLKNFCAISIETSQECCMVGTTSNTELLALASQ